jgi:hypothetical protein
VRKIPLLVTKGRSAVFTVQPLKEETAPPPLAPTQPPTELEVRASEDVDQLGTWWRAHVDLRPVIEARVEEIKAGQA